MNRKTRINTDQIRVFPLIRGSYPEHHTALEDLITRIVSDTSFNGRRATDWPDSRAFWRDKRVIVTGAAGYIMVFENY